MNILALLVLIYCVSDYVFAEENVQEEIVFKGIIKQEHDYSCGTAALATLITGTIENSHISEKDIVNLIAPNTNTNAKETGYLASDLKQATTKLGYEAEWAKIEQAELPKIELPVLLLTGLNSEFPHYIVLKGIKNNEAYLADPIRGNIRIPYDELVKEGLNTKYPDWYVMAINPSVNKPKDSNLYLAESETERHAHHVTIIVAPEIRTIV